MVQPIESEWFGFYQPGQDQVVQTLQQTDLYKEDWIGMRTLDEQGKLAFLSVDGDHLRVRGSEIFVVVVIDFVPSLLMCGL
jgi:palmitoyl-protein thioesterase